MHRYQVLVKSREGIRLVHDSRGMAWVPRIVWVIMTSTNDFEEACDDAARFGGVVCTPREASAMIEQSRAQAGF
jgi:hypothetical protein